MIVREDPSMNQRHFVIHALPIFLALLLAACEGIDRSVETPTIVESPAMAQQLLGTRPISLQSISWEDFGEAKVTGSAYGRIYIRGEQRDPATGNYLLIDGAFTRISSRTLDFVGLIEIRVDHLNGGKPYRRDGAYQFSLFRDRRFWRLVQMENPDDAIDYVDIYFDMYAAKSSQ